MKILYLKPHEERRLLAGHLWVFSNEVDVNKSPLNQFTAGELVSIVSNRGRVLGTGYINPNTLLCARLLTRDPQTRIDGHYFFQAIQKALALRERLFAEPFYRLVYGESDFLPGLVIDRYDKVFVMQITTAGMQPWQDVVVETLQTMFNPEAVYLRNDSSVRSLEGLESYTQDILGKTPEIVSIIENNLKFNVPLREGQKTGWFYDHRTSRALLKNYVKDRRVLDVFCYLGAWGINAAAYGAKEVTFLDSSELALNYAKQNMELNQLDCPIHLVKEDAFTQLKNWQEQQRFDVIILDPPAFIKKRKDIKTGAAAYLRLNELAMELLNKDGILISASCSLHLSRDMLIDAVRRAGLNAKRELQIIAQGQQGPDHPVHPAIAETEYLKTLVCRVC